MYLYIAILLLFPLIRCGGRWVGGGYCSGKNFVRLCNEYNIVGSSPLIFYVFAKFKEVCEG